MTGRHRDEPVPLRDAVAAVGRELGMPDPETVGALLRAWSEIVGPTLAAHTRVRSVQDGVCTVEVDGPGWASQIRYLETDLLERARMQCGTPIASRVRVVVAGPGRTVR